MNKAGELKTYQICRITILLVFIFVVGNFLVFAGEKSAPDRGLNPNGSYASSDIETINLQSGNLMLNVPLGSLPAGRNRLTAGLSIHYNSKLWNVDSGFQEPEMGGGYYADIYPSEDGGWNYGYEYKIKMDDADCFDGGGTKIQLVMPDGSQNLLWLPGRTNIKGYSDVRPDGSQVCGNPNPITFPTTYYTIDGTFLRLDVLQYSLTNWQNTRWILYYPDGKRVEFNPQPGSNIKQRIIDRNGNYVDFIENATDAAYSNHKTTYIQDQLGRKIIIEYEVAANQDWIRTKGYNGEEIITKVQWKNITVRKSYRFCWSGELCANQPYHIINQQFRVVDKIFLPAQIGTLDYTFSYNADNASNPTVGWGEVNGVTTPTGTQTTYSYLMDNQSGTSSVRATHIVANRPTQKTLTYNQEYDGTTVPVTETWNYQVTFHNNAVDSFSKEVATATTTHPNGVVTTDYFDHWDGYSPSAPPPLYASQRGLIRSVAADGTTIERGYQSNVPAQPSLLYAANFFAKYEFVSIKDSNGNFVKTAIKEFSQDKNGNTTEVKEYDFVPYSTVPRNAVGRPTGLPGGITPVRVSKTDFYNAAPDAASNDFGNPYIYAQATSLRIRTAAKSVEIQTANGTPVSRSEMFYDDASTAGNLTQTRSWASSKGGYSNPLSAVNSIIASTQYDQYGNPTQITDPKGTQTMITYGLINGFTGLYPTMTETASNTALKRTATAEYDFHTGLVKKNTDVDNNVSAATVYDALGRPTIVKEAVDTANEIWTQMEYNSTLRRVIVRADLETKSDGKKITIQHFDSVGRIRLSREIENVSSETPYLETDGIKIQTRYQTGNPYSYQIVSNPYRANYSFNATNEPGMGWTRSKTNNTGRHAEAETFAGASLPAPWGNNTNSTGKAQTDTEANTKIVTDQAGKKRKGVSDALGRMIEVIEDPDNLNLSTTYIFDTLGNLRRTVQGEQSRYFMYDSLGRLLYAKQPEQEANAAFSATDPVTSNQSWSVKYQYDDNGNITSTTDARGTSVAGIYDALNRLTFRNYSDATPDVTFTYDDPAIALSKGKLTKVSSSVSETRYTQFDVTGRLLAHNQITDGQTYSTAYKYNLSGMLLEETFPSGRVVKNVFDADGDLALVRSRKNQAAGFLTYASAFTYSAAGAVEKMRLGNGRWETLVYNSRLQTTQIGLGKVDNTQDLLKLEYSYGAATENNGNLREQKINVPTVGANQGFTAIQTYAYDNLNRLESATETVSNQQTWKQTFLYDRYGNRRFDTTNGNTTTLAANCPQTVCNPTVSTATNRLIGYGYDKDGNLTSDAEGKQFLYDAENHQKEVKDASNNTVGIYLYDGEGKRVKKISNTETTVFVYNGGGNLVAEYSTQTNNQPQISYLTSDHLGSPRVITGQNGNVSSRKDYTAFGEETISAQRTQNLGYQPASIRQGYTGYEKDGESGLDFAQARYYNSAHGRFTSVDPLTASATIRNPQTFNRYSYVLNSPYKFTDPLGLLSMNTTGACGNSCRNSDYGMQGGGALSSAAASGQGKSLFDTLFMPMGEVIGYAIGSPVLGDYTLDKATPFPFVYADGIIDLFGVGKGKKVFISWESKKGVITVNGVEIEAYQAISENMQIKVTDLKGKELRDESKALAKDLKNLGFSNKSNCHGFVFAKGNFWIDNNQVQNIMNALGYDPTPVKNPQSSDVAIYSVDGTWNSARHSGFYFTDKTYGSLVASKGGIYPAVSLPPGPGAGTAWYDKSHKLNYYRIKPSK